MPSVSLWLNKHISVRTTKSASQRQSADGGTRRADVQAEVQAFCLLCVPSGDWGTQLYATQMGVFPATRCFHEVTGVT